MEQENRSVRCYKCGKFIGPKSLGTKVEFTPDTEFTKEETLFYHKNCNNIITPKRIFLDRIKLLINNLLIDNHNYKGNYFMDSSKYDLLEDTKERAKYIIEEIERTKHLI